MHTPTSPEADFEGVVDLVTNEAIIWSGEEMGAKFDRIPIADADIDESIKEKAAEYRAEMIELAVEQDEDALMAYLEGEGPTETLKKCIRTGTLSGAFVPVLTGTAFKNKGVQPLLDAVVDYMPAPMTSSHQGHAGPAGGHGAHLPTRSPFRLWPSRSRRTRLWVR